MNKTHVCEKRMAQRLTTASKLTFAKKYRIYDIKHSGSIQIKKLYNLGPIKLTLHPQGNFSWVPNCSLRPPKCKIKF